MGIVLGILKLIGSILLAVLGIVLLLLLLLLLVPIRYRGELDCQEADVQAAMRASFCGPLLRAGIGYTPDQGLHWHLRILWFSLLRDQNAQNERTPAHEPTAQHLPKPDDSPFSQKPDESGPQKSESCEPQKSEPQKSEPQESKPCEPQKSKSPKRKPCEPKFEQPAPTPKKQKKRRRSSRVSDFWERIKAGVRRAREALQAFYTRFCRARDKAGMLRRLWNTKAAQQARLQLTTQCRCLLRHWRPRRIWGTLRFGFTDPADTGQALGAISVFYAWVGSRLQIQPDFEKACLAAQMRMKGHIRLVFLAYAALRLLCSRSIHRTVKRFQKITGGN